MTSRPGLLRLISALLSCGTALVSAAEFSASSQLKAYVGENVTLPCRAPSRAAIRAAEWSRPDLEPRYVFFFRDGQPDQTMQHPSLRDRVELADSRMKDGNLSVTVRNVTDSDAGTYECRVKQEATLHTKRSVIKSDPISIVHLTVQEPHRLDGQSGGGYRVVGHVYLIMCLIPTVVTF